MGALGSGQGVGSLGLGAFSPRPKCWSGDRAASRGSFFAHLLCASVQETTGPRPWVKPPGAQGWVRWRQCCDSGPWGSRGTSGAGGRVQALGGGGRGWTLRVRGLVGNCVSSLRGPSPTLRCPGGRGGGGPPWVRVTRADSTVPTGKGGSPGAGQGVHTPWGAEGPLGAHPQWQWPWPPLLPPEVRGPGEPTAPGVLHRGPHPRGAVQSPRCQTGRQTSPGR